VEGPPGPQGIRGPQGDQGLQGDPGEPAPATKTVILPIPGGYGPVVNPALQEIKTSSGSQTPNAPPVTYYQNKYDPTIDQTWFWSFPLPADYGSGGALRLTWATEGVGSNPVVWKAASAIGIVGSTDVDAAVFDTVVTALGVPNATEGIPTQSILNLTMANAGANRPIIVMIGRDADNPLDINPNFAVQLETTFEYQRA
jgi:hypothetical protein